jgi:hypothetical protein
MANLSVRSAAVCLGIEYHPSISLQDDIFGVRICGRVIATNSLREQLDFIQNSPGVIHSFTASPETFTPSSRGTEITLDWRVEKIELVRITSDVLGVVHPGFSGLRCRYWHESIPVTVHETQTFTLEALQAGHRDPEEHGDWYTRSVTVTAREEHPPPETPTGFRSLRITNCHTEERTVTIYLLDHTTGSVEARGSLRSLYNSLGSCVGESVSIELEDSHRYQIIAYDPGDPLCSPPDLTTPGCQRYVSPELLGDARGPELPITIA